MLGLLLVSDNAVADGGPPGMAAKSPAIGAQAGDVRSAATALLSRCLRSPDQPFPPEARVVPPPSGLTHDDRLAAAITPAGGSRLVVFRGLGNDLSCGIALYGAVDARTRDALVSLLDDKPGWRRRAPATNPAVDALPVRSLFWEDALAPGLAGATMTTRAPGAHRPTLEIAVRLTLVH